MLRLKEVHTHYGHSHILRGVNMEVRRGSIAALLGRNGMGKTATIRTIIGFNRPTGGGIFFKGVNIAGLPSHQIARMGMALVPQGKRIFPSLTVWENLVLGRRRVNGKKARYDLERIYDLFPPLKDRWGNPGDHLSGGEQQMLAVARALMADPEFILMDEPFEGLAPAIIRDISGIISGFKNSGLSILLVEQNIQAALQVADYVYIISKGKIVYHGTAGRLQAEESAIQRFIGL